MGFGEKICVYVFLLCNYAGKTIGTFPNGNTLADIDTAEPEPA